MLENCRPSGDAQGHGNTAAGGESGRVQAAPASSSSSAAASGANVDRVLYNNLVEMVPLVESLMDRRASSSFTRRASVIYTPAPAQLRKVSDSRGRKTVSAKKKREVGNNGQKGNQEGDANCSSRETENVQKENFELSLLREQVDNLQRTISLKEEALKSAEDSAKQMDTAYASINELKQLLEEKEAFIRSANSELYNAKIKLADKQAALEKLGWETNMSNRRIEELQDECVAMNLEISALTQIFEELSSTRSVAHPDNKNTSIHYFERPPPAIDHVTEADMTKAEDVRIRYLAALAAVKENPSDESLEMVAEARRRLEAFAF